MAPPPAERSSSKNNRVDPNKPIFKCCDCDFETNWRPSLSKHKRKHAPTKAFKCFACDYRSARRDTLMLHFRSHTGIRPYACNICDFTCALRTTLKVHKKVHTTVRSFKCGMCEKVFVKSCFLKFHEKGHMRQCPNTCNIRKCTCKNKDNVREKPYTCTRCPYRYACLGNLRLHKKIHKESQNPKSGESSSESEAENAANMSKFYAEFDKKELSELELSSSLYEQLVDEESLCSLSQFTLHKKKQTKSRKANDAKDKTKEDPAASHQEAPNKSPNANKSKDETGKNLTVVSKIIKTKSINIKNSKDKTEQKLKAVKKMIKVKSLNVNNSKDKKVKDLKAVKKVIKVKSLNVNNSKDKTEQNLKSVKKTITVKSLNVNNSKDKKQKKLTVVNKIIHNKSINVKDANNKTEKNWAASKKIIQTKSLNVNNPKTTAEKNTTEPENAENVSSVNTEFDQSEPFKLVLPSSLQEFHKITQNEFLNSNNSIDNTENMSPAYAEFDQRELSKSVLPSFYQEFHKKRHNESPNANISKDNPEVHLTELKNVENLSSVYPAFNQNKLSELALPPFYQEFYKITPNKYFNANNSTDNPEEQLIGLKTVENLSSLHADTNKNKQSETVLPPFYQEFHNLMPNKSFNANNLTDNPEEQLIGLETVENLSSLHADSNKNKQSETVLPPFYQEFHNLTPNKSVNANNSTDNSEEQLTGLKSVENLSLLHAESDENEQSEAVLPPFYQQFHKLTPNKSVNANNSKGKPEEQLMGLKTAENLSALDEVLKNKHSEAALPPFYQEFHKLTPNKSVNANNSTSNPEEQLKGLKTGENLSVVHAELDENKQSETALPPFYQEFHKLTPNKSVNANNSKGKPEKQLMGLKTAENFSSLDEVSNKNKQSEAALPAFHQEFHKLTPSKSVNSNNLTNNPEEQLVGLKTVENLSLLHAELDENKQSEAALPPFYQEFHKLTPNKFFHAKNSKDKPLEQLMGLKTVENLSLLHAQLNENKQSKVALPPFYQEFHKLTPNKCLNAKHPKTIAVQNITGLENSESMSSFYAAFDQNELSELTLAPSTYQQLVDEECLSSVSPDAIIVDNNSYTSHQSVDPNTAGQMK